MSHNDKAPRKKRADESSPNSLEIETVTKHFWELEKNERRMTKRPKHHPYIGFQWQQPKTTLKAQVASIPNDTDDSVTSEENFKAAFVRMAETPKVDAEILKAVSSEHPELKPTKTSSKKDLLSEVRAEHSHAKEHLKEAKTSSKRDLLSEVRKEAKEAKEHLKHAEPVAKQELLSSVRKESKETKEHLKHAEPAAKSYLLSEVRKDAVVKKEELKETKTSSKRDLMKDVRTKTAAEE